MFQGLKNKLRLTTTVLLQRPAATSSCVHQPSAQKLRQPQQQHEDTLSSSRTSLQTHSCGELNSTNIGETVSLCGWISHLRGKQFLVLRDNKGLTQVVLRNSSKISQELIKSLRDESVIRVQGEVIGRPVGQANAAMSTGEIEVEPHNIDVLNTCSHLPIKVQSHHKSDDGTRLKYRYIDLRSDQMQQNLRRRALVKSKMVQFLEKLDFLDVETPTMFKFTPGGADEFLVPSSEHSGQCFSLVQSPQLLKQFLMVGGINRYFQMARCYRNETLYSNRQFEFTQLDIEMSFVTKEDVMAVIQQMLVEIWPRRFHKDAFQTMDYATAMNRYGVDKPDIRYDVTLQKYNGGDCDDDIQFMVYPGCGEAFTKKLQNKVSTKIDTMFENCQVSFLVSTKLSEDGNIKQYSRLYKKKKFEHDEAVSSLKNEMKPDELRVISWGDNCQATLGRLRVEIAKIMEEEGLLEKNGDGDAFMWVSDFPMFEMKHGIMKAVHHPFTAPHPEDVSKLFSEPLSVRSLAYDLVLNGEEVGGGSIRIHDAEMQTSVLQKLLQINPDDFSYLIDALRSGAPPHGGIALGFDRLVAILCEVDSIKDVIAFPKNSHGRDCMVNAPTAVSDEQLMKYNLKMLQ